MLSADELYRTHVMRLSLAERLRLAALLLEDLPSPPSLPQVVRTGEEIRPHPKRGSGKQDISYMADDFDAPLDALRNYSE